MNIASSGGMLGKIMGGFFKEKMPKALAENFSGALERGDMKALAQLLRQVKLMSQEGEQQFLKGVLKAHGRQAEGKKGAAAALRDLVTSALSPEQRQSLAYELFGDRQPKVIRPGGPRGLEARLENFLLGIGSPDVGKLPLLRDGVEKPPQWSILGSLRDAIGGPQRKPVSTTVEAQLVGEPVVQKPAEVRANIDRIRAEMAKDQR